MAAATDIVTLTETKTDLGIADTDSSHDVTLERWISAVSTLIDNHCGAVVARTVTERHDNRGSHLMLDNPVYAITSVTEYFGTSPTTLAAEAFPAVTSNDYYQVDRTLYRRASGYSSNFGTPVVVVYQAGRYASTDVVGPLFKTAALMMLRRLWVREQPNVVRGSQGFADFVPTGTAEPGTPSFFRIVQPVLNELLAGERQFAIG